MVHTGTFFCETTTAQFLPLIPTDVILAAVIALKAYSISAVNVGQISVTADISRVENADLRGAVQTLTDLIETSLIREDSDVSIIARATYQRYN